MDVFTHITAYHWIALGLILLTAELLGAAGFLLGAAVAAFAMGTIVWLVPELGLVWQLGGFVGVAIMATLVYFKVFRNTQLNQERPLLDRQAKRLIGHKFELADDVELGTTRVQIGDTLWRVETEAPLPKGTLVEVVDAKRMSLVIAAI
jgi:membrane protein implicated in regulation of membrane protease activity